jgi:hypothetical protein
METYIKIQLTQEQIATVDAAKLNIGALNPVSSFGDKPIQVQIEGTSGETTYFWYGISNDVFQLIPVTNLPINNQSAKPIQEETHQLSSDTEINGWRGYVGENKLQRNRSNSSYANRNRSGQFRGDTRNINYSNIYGRNLR